MQDEPSFAAQPTRGGDQSPGTARDVDLIAASPIFLDVMAAALLQLAYAVLPPHRPDLVADVLGGAGLVVGEHDLFEASDLEDWQPCLLTLRLTQAEQPVEAMSHEPCLSVEGTALPAAIRSV